MDGKSNSKVSDGDDNCTNDMACAEIDHVRNDDGDNDIDKSLLLDHFDGDDDVENVLLDHFDGDRNKSSPSIVDDDDYHRKLVSSHQDDHHDDTNNDTTTTASFDGKTNIDTDIALALSGSYYPANTAATTSTTTAGLHASNDSFSCCSINNDFPHDAGDEAKNDSHAETITFSSANFRSIGESNCDVSAMETKFGPSLLTTGPDSICSRSNFCHPSSSPSSSFCADDDNDVVDDHEIRQQFATQYIKQILNQSLTLIEPIQSEPNDYALGSNQSDNNICMSAAALSPEMHNSAFTMATIETVVHVDDDDDDDVDALNDTDAITNQTSHMCYSPPPLSSSPDLSSASSASSSCSDSESYQCHSPSNQAASSGNKRNKKKNNRNKKTATNANSSTVSNGTSQPVVNSKTKKENQTSPTAKLTTSSSSGDTSCPKNLSTNSAAAAVANCKSVNEIVPPVTHTITTTATPVTSPACAVNGTSSGSPANNRSDNCSTKQNKKIEPKCQSNNSPSSSNHNQHNTEVPKSKKQNGVIVSDEQQQQQKDTTNKKKLAGKEEKISKPNDTNGKIRCDVIAEVPGNSPKQIRDTSASDNTQDSACVAANSPPNLASESSRNSVASEDSISQDKSMEEADSKYKSGGKAFGQNAAESSCKICGKHVYHMEQIKAVKAVFHKACFRCKECNKQLNVDSYSSHEGIIYCKPHFKQLFQPKAVFENGDSKSPKESPRKYELIICENTPQELPSDVIRSSAKQDDIFENINLDLSNIRNRFENGGAVDKDNYNNGASGGGVGGGGGGGGAGFNDCKPRSNSTEKITRSESIHKIMQKYQSRVSGDKDNATSSDDEGDDSKENGDITSDNNNNNNKEEKLAFSGMSALKSQWESGTINEKNRIETRTVEDELAELRQKVKSSAEPIKNAYERAIQEAKSVENLSSEKSFIVSDSSAKTCSIKERFERGAVESESDEDRRERLRKERAEEISRIAESETCTKEARNRFKQIEANMDKDNSQPLLPQQSHNHQPQELQNGAAATTTATTTAANAATEDVSISADELQQRFKYFENLKDNLQPNYSAKESDSVDGAIVIADIPKVDTTKKMLDKFKALEAGGGESANGLVNGGSSGPRSPRRMTPPRDMAPKFLYENEPIVERNPNIVRSSYKTEEDIQVEPEKAKNLRAKFENWQTEIERENRKNNEQEGGECGEYVPNIDTTKNLRAMFESINDEFKPNEKQPPRPQRVVNRFVDTKPAPGEVCYVCSARLYPMEKMEFSGIKIHKNCFRCNKCHAPLRLDNFTVRAEKLFCIPHFKQLFMEKGNYDEGFGMEQHKDKWSQKTAPVNGNNKSAATLSATNTNGEKLSNGGAAEDSGKTATVTFAANGNGHHHHSNGDHDEEDHNDNDNDNNNEDNNVDDNDDRPDPSQSIEIDFELHHQSELDESLPLSSLEPADADNDDDDVDADADDHVSKPEKPRRCDDAREEDCNQLINIDDDDNNDIGAAVAGEDSKLQFNDSTTTALDGGPIVVEGH